MPAEQSSLPLLSLAVLSGLGFAGLGVSFRLGQAKGLSPAHVALVIGVVGSAVFGSQVGGAPRPAPALIWALGLAFGATQYLAVKLFRIALARGPLSPMWCAANLGFIIAVIYSRLFLGEQPTPMQYVGVAAAVACVLVATLGQPQAESAGTGLRRLRTGADYGIILVLILGLTGLSPVFLKYLNARPFGAGRTYLTAFSDLYLLLFYGSFGLLAAGDLLVTRALGGRWRAMLAAGGLGAAGSVVGLWAWATACGLPAAVVFTVTSVVSIVVAAVVSVLAFKEKASLGWYATIGLAGLAVVLVNV